MAIQQETKTNAKSTMSSSGFFVNIKWYYYIPLLMCPYQWIVFFVLWSSQIQLALCCIWSFLSGSTLCFLYLYYRINKRINK